MDRYKEMLNYVRDIYYHDQVNWNVALGAMFLLVVYVLWLRYYNKEAEWGWYDLLPRGRGKMLRRARRNYVKLQAIDDFVHMVEERVHQGIYTRAEAKELYREAKKTWPIKDLFPNKELLKEAIRHRKAADIHAPVPLPDANVKTGESVFKRKPRLVKA